MNRRDMIITAVLVNVGLLVALVITGLKSEKKKEKLVSSPVTSSIETPVGKTTSTIILAQKAAKKQLVEGSSLKKSDSLSSKEGKENSIERKTLPTLEKPVDKVLDSQPVVIVKKGDTLEKIARRNEVTVEEILRFNQLTTTRLQIGQHLKMPAPIKKQSIRKEEGEGKYHVVKEGESPWKIAHQYGMKVEDFLRLNNLSEVEAKKLRPGRRLKVE